MGASNLLRLGSLEASSAVHDADVELVSALDDLLAGAGRDAVVDDGGVLAVVEEEHVEVLCGCEVMFKGVRGGKRRRTRKNKSGKVRIDVNEVEKNVGRANERHTSTPDDAETERQTRAELCCSTALEGCADLKRDARVVWMGHKKAERVEQVRNGKGSATYTDVVDVERLEAVGEKVTVSLGSTETDLDGAGVGLEATADAGVDTAGAAPGGLVGPADALVLVTVVAEERLGVLLDDLRLAHGNGHPVCGRTKAETKNKREHTKACEREARILQPRKITKHAKPAGTRAAASKERSWALS